MTAHDAFIETAATVGDRPDFELGQMFGKPCAKVGGKAFMAQQLDKVVFKLGGPDHAFAIGLAGAHLWDPSGKGRAMKEWVAVPMQEKGAFPRLAAAALTYVAAGRNR